MRLLYRQMRPADIEACVQMLAAQPQEADRYSGLIEQLPRAWLALLRNGSLQTTVVEDRQASVPRIAAFGVSAFISDEFLEQCKQSPLIWMAPEITRRVIAGESPVLTPNAVVKATSGSGLNLLSWVGLMFAHAPVEEDDQVNVELMRRFVEQHRGYNLKELVFQPPTAAFLRLTFNAGGFLWCPFQKHYVEARDPDVEGVTRQPFIMGVTRALALRRSGSWLSSLFAYNCPCLLLRPAERRLLLAALTGLTDAELCRELQVSLSFAKKTWRSVYERAAEKLPSLLPQNGTDIEDTQRGKEKRQKLLAYLREHPEELRPVQELPFGRTP